MRMYGRRESGQVMIMAIACFAGLVMLLSLAVNVGMFFTQRRHLQNAADASALAGAAALSEENTSRSFRDAPVLDAIRVLAQQNDVDVNGTYQLRGTYLDQNGSVVGVVGDAPQFSDAAVSVDVQLGGVIPTILVGLVGPASIPVAAHARAGLAAATLPSNVFKPTALTAPMAAFQAGTAFDLYDQSVAFTAYGVTGYRPFLDLVNAANGGTSYQPAADFGDILTDVQFWSDGLHPTGQLGIGNTVALVSGDLQEQVRAGLYDNVRRQGLVDASGAAYALIDVPLWDQYQSGGDGGQNTVTIAGFARFKIVQDEITSTTLRGNFVPFVAQSSVPDAQAGAGGASRIALLP